MMVELRLRYGGAGQPIMVTVDSHTNVEDLKALILVYSSPIVIYFPLPSLSPASFGNSVVAAVHQFSSSPCPSPPLTLTLHRFNRYWEVTAGKLFVYRVV